METTLGRRILQAFTWWNGTTFGTSFTTWKNGEKVGSDEFGNTYYRDKRREAHPTLGFERRWVLYNGEADPTTVPPGWYRWMHHLTDDLPTEVDYTPREWEEAHRPNPTGTAAAHRPHGSLLRPDPERDISAGYDAWRPE